MPWTYRQHDGGVSHNGEHVGSGYSGHGQGKNNPDEQSVKGVGPIPAGWWHMTGIENGGHTGPFTIILEPEPGTETFHRSLFRIHGDNISAPGTASDGCIILPPQLRHQMWGSGDHLLQVVA